MGRGGEGRGSSYSYSYLQGDITLQDSLAPDVSGCQKDIAKLSLVQLLWLRCANLDSKFGKSHSSHESFFQKLKDPFFLEKKSTETEGLTLTQQFISLLVHYCNFVGNIL